MKKQIVAPSKQQKGSITLVTAENGVLVAVCGCGASNKKNQYDFAEMLRRENLKRKLSNKPAIVASPQSCDCGGTILGMRNDVSRMYRTHHTKRKFLKNKRTTIRGTMTI